MILLQVSTFEEFSNWLFAIVFGGFMFVFWRWLWSTLTDIKARGERTESMMQEQGKEQIRQGVCIESMRREVDALRTDVDSLKSRLVEKAIDSIDGRSNQSKDK